MRTSYKTGNFLREKLAKIRARGKSLLGVPQTCDIEGCDNKAKYYFGPIGTPVDATGENVKTGELDFGDSNIEVIRFTGKKKYRVIYECEEHN